MEPLSHRMLEGEELVADCAHCGVLAIGLRIDGHAIYPECALCHLSRDESGVWVAFPLQVDAYRLIAGVHPRLPLAQE